jgi:hypothetical protein
VTDQDRHAEEDRRIRLTAKITETQFSPWSTGAGQARDVVQIEQKSIVPSPRIVAAMSKWGHLWI